MGVRENRDMGQIERVERRTSRFGLQLFSRWRGGAEGEYRKEPGEGGAA
jgi:hypothetical protein